MIEKKHREDRSDEFSKYYRLGSISLLFVIEKRLYPFDKTCELQTFARQRQLSFGGLDLRSPGI